MIGSDFDHCLTSVLLSRIEAQGGGAGTSLPTASSEGSTALCSVAGVRQMGEQIKKDLSSKDTACVSCRFQHTGETASVCVKRSEFEDWCSSVFDRAFAPVESLLVGLQMTREDVDEVVLVGGTTRIPRIKQMLREKFGAEKINDHIDPDITVAVGAAAIID